MRSLPRRTGIAIVFIGMSVMFSWLVSTHPLINANEAPSRFTLSRHANASLSLSPTASSSLISTTATTGPTPLTYTPTSYEAESPMNVLTGSAAIYACTKCSQGKYVAYIGKGTTGNASDNGTLTFNVMISSAGTHPLVIYYVNKDPQRIVFISINGEHGISVTLPRTSDTWGIESTVNSMSVNITLNQGHNTIEFYNNGSGAPNFDRIVV